MNKKINKKIREIRSKCNKKTTDHYPAYCHRAVLDILSLIKQITDGAPPDTEPKEPSQITELTAINMLEDMVNFLKEMEDDIRIIRQDNEKQLRDIKLSRAMMNPALEPLTKLDEDSKVFQSTDESSKTQETPQ